jgi:hypothetical protein
MFLEEKIDLLIDEQKQIKNMVEIFLPNLETEKGVIHFLEITKNTFNKYLNEGILQEGIHFVKDGRKRIFVPEEIVRLKKSGVKGRRKNLPKQDTLDAVNQKLGIIPEYRSAV